MAGLRSLLVEIYPPNLAEQGLATALHDLAGPHTGGATMITLVLDDAAIARLSPAATEAVFRIVREAIRNAMTHADATEVTVRITADPDRVRVEVDDDGVGFDLASVGSADRSRSGHLGLRLMADAAGTLGARLALGSAPGQGAHYCLEVAQP